MFIKNKTWKYTIHPYDCLQAIISYVNHLDDTTPESDMRELGEMIPFPKLKYKTLQHLIQHPDKAKFFFVIEPQDYNSIKPLSALSQEELSWFYEYKNNAVTGSGQDVWLVVNAHVIRMLTKRKMKSTRTRTSAATSTRSNRRRSGGSPTCAVRPVLTPLTCSTPPPLPYATPCAALPLDGAFVRAMQRA